MKRNTLIGAFGVGALAGLAGLVNGCGTQRIYSPSQPTIDTPTNSDDMDIGQDPRCLLPGLEDNLVFGSQIEISEDSLKINPTVIPFVTSSSLDTLPALDYTIVPNDNGETGHPFDVSIKGRANCGGVSYVFLEFKDNEKDNFADGSIYTVNVNAQDRFGVSEELPVFVTYRGGLSNSDITDILDDHQQQIDDIIEQLPPRPQDSERVNDLVDYACNLPRSPTGDIRFYGIASDLSSFVELGEQGVTTPGGEFIHHNLAAYGDDLLGDYIVAVAGEYDNAFEVDRMSSAQISGSYNPEDCSHAIVLNLDYANGFAPRTLPSGVVSSVAVYPVASTDVNSPYFEWGADDSAHSEVVRSKGRVEPMTYRFSFGESEENANRDGVYSRMEEHFDSYLNN